MHAHCAAAPVPEELEEERLAPGDHGMTGLVEDEAGGQEGEGAADAPVGEHSVSITEEQEPQPQEEGEGEVAARG